MSVDTSTIDFPVNEHLNTSIVIPNDHFLIKLSESVPWGQFANIAIDHLYKSKKKWGQKLNIRLHLGAFILQSLFRWTDRELEENLNFYAPARTFCGIQNGQKSYDHSAYTRFRNRIDDETAKKFNIKLLKVAYERGFTNSTFMDYDSTVQEANIEYPSDMRMMQSLIRKSKKILNELIKQGSAKAKEVKNSLKLDNLGNMFKSYYFAKKSTKGFELKQKLFSKAQRKAAKTVKAIKNLKPLISRYILKWNIKNDLKQVDDIGPKLLKQIRYFIKHGKVAKNKILSLHANEVKCISKGKAGKKFEFGRKFFIGRLPGNYAFTFTDNIIALEDSESLEKGFQDFEKIFGKNPDSISGDQAFWSRPNLKACNNRKIEENGINPRGYKNWKIPEERIEDIKTRRSKVESIIGHLKMRGMGKSKMKSDKMTKLDGQRSALSLNMARIIRDIKESEVKMRGDPSSLRSFGTRG